jgi:two-component system, LytTR family, response regulator
MNLVSFWSYPLLNVLIVDDERLARVELKRLLSKYNDLVVRHEADNAAEALNILNSKKIDLAFLDIQMPEMSGLALAEEIEQSVMFVFCTAFDEYAIDAFSLNALDYIVKPIAPERLQKTIGRARKMLKQKNLVNDSSALNNQSYLAESHGLLLKTGENSRIIRLKEIERFESVGNHVAVYSIYGKSFLHCSLSKIESRLDPSLFFKASRSNIVKVDCISSVEEGMSTGSLLAKMQSGQHIEVSRRQAINLKELFSM